MQSGWILMKWRRKTLGICWIWLKEFRETSPSDIFGYCTLKILSKLGASLWKFQFTWNFFSILPPSVSTHRNLILTVSSFCSFSILLFFYFLTFLHFIIFTLSLLLFLWFLSNLSSVTSFSDLCSQAIFESFSQLDNNLWRLARTPCPLKVSEASTSCCKYWFKLHDRWTCS
jgi:hypothetical protein